MLFTIPPNFTVAQEPFRFQDKVSDMTSIFFLVALDNEENSHLQLFLTHEKDGNFVMFLFDFRPNQTYVNADKTLNEEIFRLALAYDLSDSPSINYIHTNDTANIYYIQIVLLTGGPDFFTLESNMELIRYYLPALSGFQIEIMMVSLMISIAIVIFFVRKRRL